jgi:fatty-acyl-CoA synthase
MSRGVAVTTTGRVAGHPSERWASVPALLDERAAETPDGPAAAFPGVELTYRELAETTRRAARRLSAAGVGPGDRVGILLHDGSEPYVATGIGAMRLGAICLAINARNKSHELNYVLEHAQPAVLVTSQQFTGLIEETGLPEGCRLVVVGDDAEFAAGESRVSDEDVAALTAALDRGTTALLLYTSGTTSNPKGCLLSHGALLAEGANCVERLQATAADRLWTPLAMFHVGGWQSLMIAMTSGGCFSHVGFFDADTALDQLEHQRCTIAFPAFELIWLAVLEHERFTSADLGALRVVINVGIPERLVAMQKTLPAAIQVSCLGMTECCGSMCMGSPDDPLESRTTTSGRPLPGMELRALDPDGAPSPPGVAGELLFRGVTAFQGYYRDPENTARTVDAEGWIRTGDLVAILEDGTVQFQGRLKDMLKVGGENVSAAEIEGYLITHPAVAVASVVGAPDARYGEVAAAFVQLTPGAAVTEEELIDFCVGRIATFKVPRYVRFVDDYPVTATRKIKKFVLRDAIADELRERGVTEAPKLRSVRRGP